MKLFLFLLLPLALLVPNLSFATIWFGADSQESGQQTYEQVKSSININNVDKFGSEAATYLRAHLRRVDPVTSEIDVKYYPNDNTLVTQLKLDNVWIQFTTDELRRQAIALEQQPPSPSTEQLRQYLIFQKVIWVCTNPVNRASMEKGMQYFYEYYNGTALVAGFGVYKTLCDEIDQHLSVLSSAEIASIRQKTKQYRTMSEENM